MEGNEQIKKIEEPTSLSYIDKEKGFQLNIEPLDDMELRGHISPEFILLKRIEIGENNGAFGVYVNNESWIKKDYTIKP